jgi:hypothetical protein
MQILLIPLDERPVNTRYPQMIAAIGGHTLILPPRDLLSQYRQAAPTDRLIAWLHDQVRSADALIVSCEQLGYGGLITSRISDESIATITARLNMLRDIRKAYPKLILYAFSVITRISRHNSAVEEPEYWKDYGAKLFRLSQLMDRAWRGEKVGVELPTLQTSIPETIFKDFVGRRSRNHAVNREMLKLLKDGVFNRLVIASDDTSEYGLASREKRSLMREAERLGLTETLLMYPGADEVGSVLLARLMNEAAGRTPTFRPVYMIAGGENITAPFEDGAVKLTVERQIIAAGGKLTEIDTPDVWLFVHPPKTPDVEWVYDYPDGSAYPPDHLPELRVSVAQMAALLARGERVALADVAYANGASHTLLKLLENEIDLKRLTAFGAWNTAGNTLGVVIAQAYAAIRGDHDANRRFLTHHLVEDWGYQTIVRRDTQQWLTETTGSGEPTMFNLDETRAFIARRLREFADRLKLGYTLGEVRLPWARTFEVDFDLERADCQTTQPV